MPAHAYADVRQSASAVGRERERIAFDDGLALMERARAAPDATDAAHAAARHMQTLWGFLIRDLVRPENDLSQELKDNLIAVGLWVMREADAIVAGRTADWTAIIEINRTVREGLAT